VIVHLHTPSVPVVVVTVYWILWIVLLLGTKVYAHKVMSNVPLVLVLVNVVKPQLNVLPKLYVDLVTRCVQISEHVHKFLLIVPLISEEVVLELLHIYVEMVAVQRMVNHVVLVLLVQLMHPSYVLMAHV